MYTDNTGAAVEARFRRNNASSCCERPQRVPAQRRSWFFFFFFLFPFYCLLARVRSASPSSGAAGFLVCFQQATVFFFPFLRASAQQDACCLLKRARV
jgi:hypothetical protein